MTKQDFLDQVYIETELISNSAGPGYDPAEISKEATKAQEKLIINTYNDISNRLREGYEESEKRIQDLGELVTNKIYTTFSPNSFYQNAVEVTLPDTQLTNTSSDTSDVFWLTVLEDSEIDELDCNIVNNSTIYLRPEVVSITHGELKKALKNPFRKPSNKKILRLRTENRKHILLTDGTYNITRYYIAYIKKPNPIDLTTNLNDPVSQLADIKHRELVSETVKLLCKDIQTPEKTNQLNVEQNQINE